MTFNNLSFEEKVLIAMKRKKLTYKDIANEFNISIGYVSDIVNGNRKAEHYRKKIKEFLEIQ